MSSVAAGMRAIAATAPGVPSADRERLESAITPLARRHGGAVIRTCHRVEWYHDGADDPLESLASVGATIPPGATVVSGLDAVSRLITLTLGLDSIVLAEDQILHQARSAVVEARASGPFGGELGFAFDAALHAGRLGRTWRSSRPISIADVAIGRAEAVIGDVRGRLVLVVGAGEIGRLAAGAARSRGATVAIASRTAEHARATAATLGVEPWPVDPGAALADAAVVVVALGGQWTIGGASVRALLDGPLVIDLSMPPALAETVRHGLAERYIGIDDLAVARTDTAADETLALETARLRERLVDLRDQTLRSFRDRAEARQAAGAARALAAVVERERRAALATLFHGHPDLEAVDQAAIEAMTVQLTDRLFGTALGRLATDGDGPSGRAVRDVFGL